MRNKFKGGIRLPWIIPAAGIIICVYLMTQCALNQIMIGAVLIALGVPVFLRYVPGKEVKSVKRDIALRKGPFSWVMHPEKALAHFLTHLYGFLVRMRGKI